MKNYTDLEQSKRLAEILPLESADMYYDVDSYGVRTTPEVLITSVVRKKDVPCWSLAALLEILNFPELSKDKLGEGKVGWMVSIFPDNRRYDSDWHDNPVDACVEMIIKIYEQKLL